MRAFPRCQNVTYLGWNGHWSSGRGPSYLCPDNTVAWSFRAILAEKTLGLGVCELHCLGRVLADADAARLAGTRVRLSTRLALRREDHSRFIRFWN
jgi:hypothetical protein